MSDKPLVVAIANRKGGTGKTTTAVNLAAGWGQRGHRTLLVDLDTQGHAAIGVGCRERRLDGGGIHRALQEAQPDLAPLICPTPVSNVWLAPADTDAGLVAEVEVASLRRILTIDLVSSRFDRVVLDTPPTLDAWLISALAAADGVIVPFVPHHLAEVGVRQLARLFYQVTVQHNPSLRLLALLPVQFDRHVRLHQRVLVELAKQFGRQRILRGIRNNIKLAEAFEAGQPIAQYAPRSAGSMDYQLMVEELETFLPNGGRP